MTEDEKKLIEEAEMTPEKVQDLIIRCLTIEARSRPTLRDYETEDLMRLSDIVRLNRIQIERLLSKERDDEGIISNLNRNLLYLTALLAMIDEVFRERSQ